MKVVITDLDGTLLDHDTYSWEAARPALERLRQYDIPLIFSTSKTRVEVEEWRATLENRHPFIVENGGALYIPQGYFRRPHPFTRKIDGYEVFEFGEPYHFLVEALVGAAAESACSVEAFSDLSPEQIAQRAAMPVRQASLAKQREYDEVFAILGGDGRELLAAIERRGKRWTRGGRFYHITGRNHKGLAAFLLLRLFDDIYHELTSIGLGDSANDIDLLRAVDFPVIVRSPESGRLLQEVPNARATTLTGPEGWNSAILEMIP
ncbi:MAG TPA: HAD-IIB family hydrolase [Bryobacteraceae bacterium]|nr:HAD-IIB family hydrolase [Bryobacteraceae bacterium]